MINGAVVWNIWAAALRCLFAPAFAVSHLVASRLFSADNRPALGASSIFGLQLELGSAEIDLHFDWIAEIDLQLELRNRIAQRAIYLRFSQRPPALRRGQAQLEVDFSIAKSN